MTSMTYNIKTPEGNYRLDVVPDPSPFNPREDQDNMATIVYSHRRYVLGDERARGDDFEEHLSEKGINPQDVVSLPVYLLDHSGLRLSTEDFNDPWDSGCVGAIYITFDNILSAWGEVSEETLARAKEVLISEIQEMDNYLSGNIYGFILYKEKDGKMTEIESCFGFQGADIFQNGMLDHIPSEISAHIPTPAKIKLG